MSGSDEMSETKLVRRFTAELKPDSDLAIQTKQYQEDLDAERDAKDKLRMGKVYDNTQTRSQITFRGAEIARQTLQSKCDQFFASIAEKEESENKTSSVLRIFKHRKPTEQKLANEIRAKGEFTVSQVSSITTQLEKEWKESHSKATTNFLSICQKLDDHKQIFQWFPDQTIYTSTLCGAVTMVIQASVNYSSIAEQLSSYVVDLSDSIGVCTKWLNLYDQPSMQERLSDIYTQFFDFFIKVASWYLKPKPSKWLDSFNSNFSARYASAMNAIKNSIQLIREEAEIETALEVKGIVPHMDQSLAGLEERIIAQVLQSRREANEVGRGMYHLLMETAREAVREVERLKDEIDELKQGLPRAREVAMIEHIEDIPDVIEPISTLSRGETENVCLGLQSTIDQIGGSDGIRLAIQAGKLVAEPTMVHVLGKWTQATSKHAQILWIICPWETGPQTSAQLAALGIIWTAIQAKAQFISFVCQRPHYGKIPNFKGTEDKAGVLAMVYSLIQQLLQFRPPDDKLCIPVELVDKLTQTDDNWESAINMLEILLENTPTLRYCIISGLNLLEGGARDMCQTFVNVLLAHVQKADWPVRLLFTTPGQSRVLSQSVARDSKIMTNNTFHQTKGRTLYSDLKLLP